MTSLVANGRGGRLSLAPLACLLGMAPAMAAPEVADIQQCMKANFVDRGTVRDFRVETDDGSGLSKSINAKLYWLPTRDGFQRINLRVQSPASLAGSAFLLRGSHDGEDVHIYLPAIQSVRRITGQDRSRSLWGTDFSVEDIKQLQGLLADGKTRREADEEIEGRKTYVLTTVAENIHSRYQKVTSYVDRQSCLLLKSVYFESTGKPAKILTAAIRTIASAQVYDRKVWMVFGYTMRDLERGSVSKLSMGDVFLMYKELPARAFNPQAFYKDFD